MLQALLTSFSRCPQEASLDFGKNQSSYLCPTHEFAAVQAVHEEMNIVWFQQDFYFRWPAECQLCSPVLASVRNALPTLAWKRSLYKAGWIPCPLVSKRWVLLHVLPQPSGTWLCATFHTLSPALSGPWSWCGSQNAGFCLSAPYLGTPVWLAGKLCIFPQSSFWGDVPVRRPSSGALLSQLCSFLHLRLHLAFVCESFCEPLSYTREFAESLVR